MQYRSLVLNQHYFVSFRFSVKPAIFDLFLTIVIMAYLYVVYLLVIFFPNIYGTFQKLHHTQTQTTNGVKKNH